MIRDTVAGLPALMLLFAVTATAEEMVHQQIDRAISAGASGHSVAPQADDAEFLRRVYLDLVGRIPTLPEAKRFLDDASPNRRALLIDELLQSPEHSRRMSEVFHVMLMERRGEHDEWKRFLEESFRSNKPWDQFVREILSPNPDSESARGAAFFFTKRLEKVGQQETDYPGLTRDIGRLFLGQDLQCAQCHDHLLVEDYRQQDFQGLFIAYSRTKTRSDVKFPAIAEMPISEKLSFASVFDPTPHTTGPRVPGGEELPLPAPSKEATKAGGPLVVLKVLADQIPKTENKFFARNIANRLWFTMMGRGLVHPLDLHHSDNPPSHPEVLDLLATELAAHQFDIRWMLRELSLTEAYQRSSRAEEGQTPPPADRFLLAHEKRMSPEQILRSVIVATGREDQSLDQREQQVLELRESFIKAFANEPGDPEEDVEPSVKGALFLLNGDPLLGLIEPKDGNLVDRLVKQSEVAALANELYLSVLSRSPSDEEQAEVREFLESSSGERTAAVKQLVWALLTSVEFQVNH